jgi:predicted nucleic acid-binding Zn ribbon protein
MQQMVNCPSCGSPINQSQKFCGVCGLNLESAVQQKAAACPTCGLPISPGQQFCGSCGTKLSSISQQPPQMAQPAIPKDTPAATPSTPTTTGVAPIAAASAPPEANQTTTPRRHGILSTTAVIFQIFGWIILVFGVLASIAMAVFAGIGGTLMSAMPGMGTMGGTAAIGMAIGGIIVSLLYGFGFLAFAEICYAVRDIRK